MTFANSLKNLVAPVALAVSFGVAANDAHALDFGCRDKEQIKAELMAENQVPVVRFYIGEVPSGESKTKWNENFFTMNTQTREGFRMSRGENTEMCIISNVTDIRLYNPRSFDKRAYLADRENFRKLESRIFLWDTETHDFGGERLTGTEIMNRIGWFEKKENQNKIRELLKLENKTEHEINKIIDKRLERDSLIKQQRESSILFDSSTEDKQESRINNIISGASKNRGENPIFRAQEYYPVLNLKRITYILANPRSGNEGGEIHSTLDGKWLREFSKSIPNAQSGYANVDHGAELTNTGKLLVGIKDDGTDQQAAKPQ